MECLGITSGIELISRGSLSQLGRVNSLRRIGDAWRECRVNPSRRQIGGVWTGQWSLQIRHPQGAGFSPGTAATSLLWHSGNGYGFLTEVNAGPGSCTWSVLIGDSRRSRGALSLRQHPVGAVLEVAAAAAHQVAVSRGHLRAAPRAGHRSSAGSGGRFTSKGTLQPEFHPHPPTGTGGVGLAAGQSLPGPVVRNNSWSTRLSEPSINEMSSRPTAALPAPGRACGVFPRTSSRWWDSLQIQRRFSPE